MSPSKILFYLCLAFILGIALSSFVSIPQIFLWGFFIGVMIFSAASFLLRKKWLLVGAFCLCALLLGVTRFHISQFTIFKDLLVPMGQANKKVTLTGTVVREPDIRLASQKLVINVKGSNVLITTSKSKNYQYLDVLQVTGKLKLPNISEDFNYREYLAKEGIYTMMDHPDITILPIRPPFKVSTFLYKQVLFAKTALIKSLETSLSPPHSTVLKGMVFGQDQQMPLELKNKFNATGLSHVTAVSGSNIVIITSLIMALLLYLGFWRNQAFYGSVAFVWFYIILIGFPASGVRAAIMACIALLAQKVGRQQAGLRMLTLTATIMLFLNPRLLIYDIGFQLSFLASLGIMRIKPAIDFLYSSIPSVAVKKVCNLISITLSAQVITLPIILYNFDTVSLVAPLTNLLALPVVEVLTILGFLLAVAGLIFPIVNLLLALPCWILLTYFLKILDIFSQSWAVFTLHQFSLLWFFICYLILILLMAWWHHLEKSRWLQL